MSSLAYLRNEKQATHFKVSKSIYTGNNKSKVVEPVQIKEDKRVMSIEKLLGSVKNRKPYKPVDPTKYKRNRK